MCPIGRQIRKDQPEYVATGNTSGAPGTAIPTNVAGIQSQGAVGSNLPGPALNTAGPHRHDILNKLDPTVDSQSGGAQVLGPGAQSSRQAYAQGHGHDTTNNTGPDSSNGLSFPAGNTRRMDLPPAPTGNVPEDVHGPHSSRLANKFDPQVDSDMDIRGATYAQQRHTGTAQCGAPMTNTQGEIHGRHMRRPENTRDPRLDQDPNIRGSSLAQEQSQGWAHGGGHKPGPAPNTSGPHRSDFVNKLDPNVDSKRMI